MSFVRASYMPSSDLSILTNFRLQHHINSRCKTIHKKNNIETEIASLTVVENRSDTLTGFNGAILEVDLFKYHPSALFLQRMKQVFRFHSLVKAIQRVCIVPTCID